MENFRYLNKISLKDIDIEEIVYILKKWEFKVLLQHEELTKDIDIMLENMLEYFVAEEMYEYAVIVRDEIKSRELEPRKKIKE